jgi:hypothetical protein
MKQYRVYNYILVLVFVLAMIIPVVFMNTNPGKISEAENRVLAGFPSLRGPDQSFNKHILSDFENWFNDNLGWRDRFTMLNTKIQYHLFGHITKSDTMMGRDQWLYYVTPEIIRDYQHLNLPSDTELAAIGGQFQKISDYLQAKGIPSLYMMVPDKKTVYPENYPDTILQVGEKSRTDVLIDYMSKYTDVNFFTPEPALKAAKLEATVYSERVDNAHWNSYGAFVGYQELMSRVKQLNPKVKVLKWDDFEITREEQSIKIYNALKFTESGYVFNWKVPTTASRVEGLLDNIPIIYPDYSYTYVNADKNLAKALVVGDSYFYGHLIPFLAESFSEFTFVHTENMGNFEKIVNIVQPDIVIYENAERMFDHDIQVISNSLEQFEDYSIYKELPVESDSQVWIDYANNALVQNQKEIEIDKDNNIVSLFGWALDSREHSTASHIFLKVGDTYYPGTYGSVRTSVSDFFQNPELTNSGFEFFVKSSELIKAGKFSLIVISNDRSYQYAPVDVQVKVKP